MRIIKLLLPTSVLEKVEQSKQNIVHVPGQAALRSMPDILAVSKTSVWEKRLNRIEAEKKQSNRNHTQENNFKIDLFASVLRYKCLVKMLKYPREMAA